MAQAGRGGGTGSGSNEEDYFAEQGSVDDGREYYDSEDEQQLIDTSMRLYLDSADSKVRGQAAGVAVPEGEAVNAPPAAGHQDYAASLCTL